MHSHVPLRNRVSFIAYSQMRSLMLAGLLDFPSLGDQKSIVHAQSWIDMELCEPPTLHSDAASDSSESNAAAMHRSEETFASAAARNSFSPFSFASIADDRRSDKSTSGTCSSPNNGSGSTSGNYSGSSSNYSGGGSSSNISFSSDSDDTSSNSSMDAGSITEIASMTAGGSSITESGGGIVPNMLLTNKQTVPIP